MKAYFLPLGEAADRSLPAILAAFSCGAVREVPEVSMLRILPSAPDSLAGAMMEDINACHRFFAGKDAFSLFRASFSSEVWQPELPERSRLIGNEASALLLSALRGENQPLSFRTDREAAEWALSALLEEGGDACAPLLRMKDEMALFLARGEDVRVMLLCDLTDGFAAGLACAVLRFCRRSFPEKAPFLGLIAEVRDSAEGALGDARSALSALSDRQLVRPSDDRETTGADACWLLGLPASLVDGEESRRLMDWAAARVLGEALGGPKVPSAGLHTREAPGILTLQALDQQARPAAAFLRGAFWCLSDLFPSLRQFFDHPALLRSLAPASRGGLFRRIFRSGDGGVSFPRELDTVERALKAICLQILTLIRALPAPLREADQATALWQEAVRACGRWVTVASEYDVSRKEAEDSGLDKVQPVHRDSMSDTAEEEQLRKLDRMAATLSAAEGERAGVFRALGGFRARQALEDCLARCRVAEVSAREKLVLLPAGSAEERYALGLQERRVRMLKAAVDRCLRDLEAACGREALFVSASQRPSSPFAGEILDPALAESAFTMLTASGEESENAARTLRDGLGSLLKGYPMNDSRMLLKNLLTVCRRPDAEAPLRSLMEGVFSVCGVEVSGVRFQSAGDVPAVPLLPDLRGESRFFPLSAAAGRLIAPVEPDRTHVRRGLLALLILREYRRRAGADASLELLPISPGDAPLSQVYLSSRGAKGAFIACLCRESRRVPVAVLLPGLGLEPAHLMKADTDLIPSFAVWADRETAEFRDPCLYLSEGDRRILTEQLTRMRADMKDARSKPFLDFLADWHQDIVHARPGHQEDPSLSLRLRIACGLTRLPIWQKELSRAMSRFESGLETDAVCAALSGSPSFAAAQTKVSEDVLYTFRGTPLARESAVFLLESAHAPEEETLLASLNTECDILEHSSDDYHEALAAGLEELLARYPGADPQATAVARKLLEEAKEPIREEVTELTWPWDTVSASVQTILTECLGPELASAALRPFSEALALIPARGGEVIGDALLSSLCLISREADAPAEAENTESSAEPAADFQEQERAPAAAVRSDAALPPLDPDFAALLCRTPRGRTLIRDGFLSFSAEGSRIRASLTLEGAFTLKLTRVYAGEEIIPFYAHDLPTVALWPSLPFDPEKWQAYFTYAHCPEDLQISLCTGKEIIPVGGSAPRFSACTPAFPLCYLFRKGGRSVGALPNLLPAPDLPASGDWTACIDFGASALSVIFTEGSRRFPLQGPVSVRTILRSPAAAEDLLWREFLPAVPVSALLPAALRIFRNEPGAGDLPFRDSCVFMSSSLRDVLDVPPEALYTDLKWNGEKGRSVRLCLHQVMLMAALQARLAGAASLGWRAALPDEMASEGRDRLADLFHSLAEKIRDESGLPLPPKAPPVLFAPESSALGAYFRFCSPDNARCGFMTLDLGADTADISLFLRGREAAARTCQLPLGFHNMLLPDLLRDPDLIGSDFGFIPDPLLQEDLAAFRAVLDRARSDAAALRQARYALDALVADHGDMLLSALAQRRADGAPGRSGALVLFYAGWLMMLCGLVLLQIAGDSQRNDSLPESMTLFLAGRGAGWIERMSPPVKTALWHFLTMFRNPRVSSLYLVFSAEKKLEIPVGLSLVGETTAGVPRPSAVPASISVRPEELLPEFLVRFRREFPQEAALLFPGLYANDYYDPFTPFGRQAILQAGQAAFAGRGEAPRPYSALSAFPGLLMDILREGFA